MATLQSFAPLDVSTLANYLLWAQAPGNALNALGWQRQSGHGEVIWGNVVAVNMGSPGQQPVHPTGQYNFRGAFSGGTSYLGSLGNNDVVTNGGLTYICVSPTQTTLTQVIQNTALSLTVTSCGSSSGGSTASYNDSGLSYGATDSKKGYVFVVTGFANANNNGTFICTTNTNGTLTLTNANATAETHAATATSSTANAGYLGNIVNGAGAVAFPSGAFVGKAFTVAGFANGANNGNFTCVASSSAMIGLNNGSAVAVTAAGTLTSNEPPATSLASNTTSPNNGGFWFPYNFEIWKSNGPMSATNPIYLRLAFFSSNTSTPSIDVSISTSIDPTTGWIAGNAFNPGGTGFFMIGGNNVINGGNTMLECDFAGDADNFRMAMFRNSSAASGGNGPLMIVIDRAKSSAGTDLDTYTWVGIAGNITCRSQVLFKPGAGGVSGNTGLAEPFWSPLRATGTMTNLIGYGSTPLLIIPIIGYLANPQLGACIFKINDVGVSGSRINVVLYGTSHTYLLVKGGVGNVVASSGEGATDGAIGSGVIGIQWE